MNIVNTINTFEFIGTVNEPALYEVLDQFTKEEWQRYNDLVTAIQTPFLLSEEGEIAAFIENANQSAIKLSEMIRAMQPVRRLWFLAYTDCDVIRDTIKYCIDNQIGYPEKQ